MWIPSVAHKEMFVESLLTKLSSGSRAVKGRSQPFCCIMQTQLSYEFSMISLQKWIQSPFHGLDVNDVQPAL